MIIYKDLVQGTQEWLNVRIGKITGSRIKELTAKDNLPLVYKLIAETVSEQSEEVYITAAMQRGEDLEPVARSEYEEYTGSKVSQVGFVQSSKYDFLGHSPDGLIVEGDEVVKGIEIKCPSTNTHVKYIIQNRLPSEYKGQVLNMFLVCPTIQEVDFISYDDRFTIKPLHIVNIRREDVEADLRDLEMQILKFWAKYQAYYNQVTF